MDKVRAFVGHSFDEKDKAIVGSFTDYFDSLKIGMLFDWDHAKRAEARAISDKVTGKMEGKNLFIGIFTKEDYRIALDDIVKEDGDNIYTSKSNLNIGISDWIVQESGYALGKGMSLLFLIEEGINRPSGLQGDLECIEFKRDNPELSFQLIVEAIGNLIKNLQEGRTVQESVLAYPEVEVEEEDEKDIELKRVESTELDSTTDRAINDYTALKTFIIEENDLIKANNKLDRILSDCEGTKGFDEIFWRIQFLNLKIKAGYPEGFEELQELAENNDTDIRPIKALAIGYKKYRIYPKAAMQYQLIADKEGDNDKKIDNVIKAAECHAKDNNYIDAKSIILIEFHNKDYNEFQLSKLYKELALLSKEEGNDNHYISFTEKALAFSPADEDLRFKLAYYLSEIEMNDLSYYHYRILCTENPTAWSFNNIGVLYDQFKIPGKAVSSFQKALEHPAITLLPRPISQINTLMKGFMLMLKIHF